ADGGDKPRPGAAAGAAGEHEQHVRAGREHQDRDQGQVGEQNLAADDPHARTSAVRLSSAARDSLPHSDTIEPTMLVFWGVLRCDWMITDGPRDDPWCSPQP